MGSAVLIDGVEDIGIFGKDFRLKQFLKLGSPVQKFDDSTCFEWNTLL